MTTYQIYLKIPKNIKKMLFDNKVKKNQPNKKIIN